MNRLVFIACLVSIAGFAQTRNSNQSIFGRNLLVNGGGEADMADNRAVPGWGDPQEGFETEHYGHTASEWDTGLNGCAACGQQYFRLHWDGDAREKSASQTVDVSRAANDIDAGKVTAKLSGYLGGMLHADTTAQLVAVYEDAAGKELGTFQTQAVDTNTLVKPQSGDASLNLLESSAPVPAGTRKVKVRLVAKANGPSGSYLALADNLSFQLARTE